MNTGFYVGEFEGEGEKFIEKMVLVERMIERYESGEISFDLLKAFIEMITGGD